MDQDIRDDLQAGLARSQQQILNATITIEEVVDKDKKLSIKGNNGSRSFTYSIWKTKQDGADSATFAQFKNMGIKVGSTVMIGYVIDEYETEINGFPKKIQSKKIINFRETNEAPRSAVTPPNLTQTKDDAFWERQAYEKCCSLWAGSLIESGIQVGNVIERINAGESWLLFQAIKADGATRFSRPIQQGDDLNVDDVPF